MTDLPAPTQPAKDRPIVALGMLLAAMLIGWSIDRYNGNYGPDSEALLWLTGGLLIAFGCVFLKPDPKLDSIITRRLSLAMVLAIVFEGATLLHEAFGPRDVGYDVEIPEKAAIALGVATIFGVFQTIRRRALRWVIFAAMLIAYFAAACLYMHAKWNQGIDVLMFQENSAGALAHARNPYAIRFPNVYGHNTPFYGPGVVDENNQLTYGFPYPPLSFLMVMPAYLITGNIRHADIVAIALSAVLMALARPGKWGALAAAIFLLTLRGFYVITLAWTEPLLTLTFSLAMFCACRWPRAMPWMLGLYFATKQYTVLSVPTIWLLADGPHPWKQAWDIAWKAGMVVAATIAPFFLWNPHEFIRAVVMWQLVQPFRIDALSYLVWIYKNYNGYKPPIWAPLMAVVPAAAIALKKCARTPAGFAAAVTLINLAFFAFNKQAFCNYYFFVIATGCWAIAAMKVEKAA